MRILTKLEWDKRTIVVAAILILALATAIRFYHIDWTFSSNGIDEGIMLERAQMVSRGYLPYAGLPLDQAPLSFLIGGEIWGDVVLLRAFAASLSVLAVAACMEAARRIRGNYAMLVTGVLLALDFAFLRETRTFSLNGLSSSVTAISFLFFVIYFQKGSRTMLVLSGLVIGIAASMKLFGALGFAGMAFFLGVELLRSPRTRKRGSVDLALMSASAAIPLILLMAYLGPSEMIRGMVLDQGHRAFEPFQKLGLLAYFGTNLAYLLPLAYVRKIWRLGPEIRFLLCAAGVMLVFMIVEPLMFYHHLVMLSPALAVLAGVFVSGLIVRRNEQLKRISPHDGSEKGFTLWRASMAATTIGLLVSSGLAAYGIVAQGETTQQVVAKRIAEITGADDWIVSGDPTISAFANRQTPPTLINLAFRQYPDITLDDLEDGILENNVSVVIQAYRLNTMDGLGDFLSSHGYTIVSRDFFGYGDDIAIYTFNEQVEPLTFYVRDDIVSSLGLPVPA